MILTVTLNPSLDQTLFLDHLKPSDTNRVQRVEMDAGGKGLNLSRVAAELFAPTVATGFLGGGPATFVEDVCRQQGVEASFVPTRGETRTNISIEVATGEPPTTLNASGPEIQIDEWDAFCAAYQAKLPSASWVCLCGSVPRGVAPDAYAHLVRLAHEAGKKALVDADGPLMMAALEAHPNMIKPNAEEAARLLGHPVDDFDVAVTAVKELHARMGGGDRIALISLGSDGALMATQHGVFRGVSPEIEPVSTVGSGDSMLGAMLAALLRGDEPAVAFQWGLAAGAATATTDGARIGRRAVIELLFNEAKVIALS